jgi:methylmalonyl-CoA/ethylmalonyl-CoA epimerase
MQVAMITRDLDAAMKHHWDTCKIGPLDIYQFEPGKIQNFVYRGKPATHTCLIAIALP